MFRLYDANEPRTETPVTKLQLAEWIEKGLDSGKVKENSHCFLVPNKGLLGYVAGQYQGCALGMALVGKYGNARAARNAYVADGARGVQSMHRLLGIDKPLASNISSKHSLLFSSARGIAEELRRAHQEEMSETLEKPKTDWVAIIRADIERMAKASAFAGIGGRLAGNPFAYDTL